jgi:transposase
VARGPRHLLGGEAALATGINYLTALSLVCEVEDFSRFASAAHYMAFLGLVPREYFSCSWRLQGGITKTGNIHLRRLLVEAAWHYRTRCTSSKDLRLRRHSQPPEVVACAERASARLHRTYMRLVLGRGCKTQVAVTAVARELAGFIWGLPVDAVR